MSLNPLSHPLKLARTLGLALAWIAAAATADAVQHLKPPSFKDGYDRQMVVLAENVPEYLETDLDEKTRIKYELDDVEITLGYNDGEKNKLVQINMVKIEPGKWLGNLHRSMIYPAGLWFGNLYQARISLRYNAPDDSQSLIRTFTTAPGQLLQLFHCDSVSLKPKGMALSLGDIDLKKD